MSLIVSLIIGGIIGWLAAKVAGRDEGIIASVVIGVIGSIIGNALAYMLGSGDHGYLAFSWSSIIWSFIGALILSFILNAVQHRSTHHHIGA